jgi:hypothetical protein
VEALGGAKLRFDHHAKIGGVFSVGYLDLIGGEHHGDGHDRQVIDRPGFHHRHQSLVAVHSRGFSG